MSTAVAPRFDPARRRRVTFALLLVTALASFESTVVATAMPTVVGEMGGLALYPWVFAVFLFASTVTMPLYGRIADVTGRRGALLSAIVLFVSGSLLCALARSMNHLVLARGLQGLGAGGLVPVALTVAGDLFSLDERARVQGLFSGVWGVASLVGPLTGAFVTETFGWRWVFAPMLPLGLLAFGLVATQLVEAKRPRAVRPSPALAGLLSAEGVVAAYVASVLLGTTIYGVTVFVPLFVQGARGGTATSAGAVVTPLVFGWSISALGASRAIPRFGFRTTALLGAAVVATGLVALVVASALGASTGTISAACGLIGLGLGPSSLAQLLSVQHFVQERQRGIATSLVPFFRTVGGSLGVAGLGTLVTARLGSTSGASRLLDPGRGSVPVELREALGKALVAVFGALLVLAVVNLAAARRLPRGVAKRD
ncbi:MAG: MFS transporter [Acidithiobacillales bacterium]